MRLDLYLAEKGLTDSRARAQELIREGYVSVNGEAARKVSRPVGEDDVVAVTGAAHDYVSRGGLKLAAALDHFGFDPEGRIALDLGASTGGFCDVLLRRGAEKIYAVDVGHGQLHERVRSDPRIVNLERTHAKLLDHELVPDDIEILVCDVSFISLKKALPPALALCAPGAILMGLVKPQFEVGPEQIGKGGLVRVAPETQEGVAEDIARWLSGLGWKIEGYTDSPVKGGDGNREFLLGARII